MVARLGFEPVTLWMKGVESAIVPSRPTSVYSSFFDHFFFSVVPIDVYSVLVWFSIKHA